MQKDNEGFPWILTSETHRAIRSAKSDKTLGPDKIKNQTLEDFADVITNPLTRIFNKILEVKTVPTQWNTAEIIILHKKGDKKQLSNYL